MARFYDPTSGRVLVDGHDLREVTAALAALADGRRAAGGVPVQRHDRREHRLRARGRDARGGRGRRPRRRRPRVHRRRSRRATTRPTGERGAQLSAGQRQLVAFARALIADPRILVLDEATSNVDIHTEGRIEAGLRRLLAGRTAIVIAHRLSTIQRAPAGSSCSTTAASSSRAPTRSCWRRRAPTGACTATGRSRPPPETSDRVGCGAGTRTPIAAPEAGVLPLDDPATGRSQC